MKIDIRYNWHYMWKIVFTILIALLHSGFIANVNMGWYLAVDYFFIMSGFWLCNHYEIYQESGFVYMLKRIKKLFPHQVIAFIAIFAWQFVMTPGKGFMQRFLRHLCELVPFAYFIQDNAYMGEYCYNFPVWYLSVLLLVSLIIYYGIHNNKKLFTQLISPLVIVLLYGYLYREYPSFNVGDTVGLLNIYYLRGFVDMCVGVLLFYLVNYCTKYMFTRFFLLLCNIMEIICLGGVIIITYNHAGKNDLWCVLLISCGVFFSFFHSKVSMFNSVIFKKLNGLMYPVYLNHILVISVLNFWGIKGGFSINVVIYLFALLMFAYFMQHCEKGINYICRYIVQNYFIKDVNDI